MSNKLSVVFALFATTAYGFNSFGRRMTSSSYLDMAITDEPLLKVTNAFDSPSIRKLQKDPKDFSNAFDSPSCKVNGGDSDRKIKLFLHNIIFCQQTHIFFNLIS